MLLHRKKQQLKFSVCFFVLVLGLSNRGLASDLLDHSQGQFQQQNSFKKLKISLDAFFARLESTGSQAEGFGFQGGLLFAITEKIGAGALVSQVITGNNKSSFTQISLEGRWALTGSHIIQEQVYSVNGRNIIEASTKNRGGLMAHGFVHFRRFLGGTGYGGGLSYEFPLDHEINFRLGSRADYATDWAGSHLLLQGFTGLTLWF